MYWYLIIHVMLTSGEVLEGIKHYDSSITCRMAMEETVELLEAYLEDDEESLVYCMEGGEILKI